MSSSTVLYDVPGPSARARNRILSVVTVAIVAAFIGWIVYLLISTEQFSAGRVAQFQYAAVQRALLSGYLATLKAAGIAAVLALLLGAVLASGRLSEHTFLRVPSVVLVEFFRGVPLLILIFFFYYGSLEYELGLSPMWAVILGLTLYNGSVLAEIFRAGIGAVPRGQAEAAYALGLRKSQVMVQVLLPQAVRSMLPSIISQLVVLLKDTALGFIVTYNELLYVARQIGGRGGSFDFPYVLTYLIVAVIYIATCFALSLLASWLEKRSRRSPRVVADVPQDAGAPAA